MDFDSIYNSVKSNDSVEGTDHYDAPEGADAFMPSATGNAAVTRIIQPSDMPASAVAAADTSMPAQPLQITDGDDNQVVESTDAFEATNAPDPNQAPDPDQKPKRKSSTKGRKLIRWNPALDQLVMLSMEYVATEQGFTHDWDAIARRVDENLTGEALKQHLWKVRVAREGEGQNVPPRPGRAQKKNKKKSVSKPEINTEQESFPTTQSTEDEVEIDDSYLSQPQPKFSGLLYISPGSDAPKPEEKPLKTKTKAKTKKAPGGNRNRKDSKVTDTMSGIPSTDAANFKVTGTISGIPSTDAANVKVTDTMGDTPSTDVSSANVASLKRRTDSPADGNSQKKIKTAMDLPSSFPIQGGLLPKASGIRGRSLRTVERKDYTEKLVFSPSSDEGTVAQTYPAVMPQGQADQPITTGALYENNAMGLYGEYPNGASNTTGLLPWIVPQEQNMAAPQNMAAAHENQEYLNHANENMTGFLPTMVPLERNMAGPQIMSAPSGNQGYLNHANENMTGFLPTMVPLEQNMAGPQNMAAEYENQEHQNYATGDMAGQVVAGAEAQYQTPAPTVPRMGTGAVFNQDFLGFHVEATAGELKFPVPQDQFNNMPQNQFSHADFFNQDMNGPHQNRATENPTAQLLTPVPQAQFHGIPPNPCSPVNFFNNDMNDIVQIRAVIENPTAQIPAAQMTTENQPVQWTPTPPFSSPTVMPEDPGYGALLNDGFDGSMTLFGLQGEGIVDVNWDD